MGEAGGVLGQAMFDLARVLLRKGRVEARKAASTGRLRLDLRQLLKDRDAMYTKLGRELRHLVEGGELDHPGLKRGVERIGELDRRIDDLKRELALAGEAEPDSDPEGATTAPESSAQSD